MDTTIVPFRPEILENDVPLERNCLRSIKWYEHTLSCTRSHELILHKYLEQNGTFRTVSNAFRIKSVPYAF